MPYMKHIGMCRCEGYGFQATQSGLKWELTLGKKIKTTNLNLPATQLNSKESVNQSNFWKQ